MKVQDLLKQAQQLLVDPSNPKFMTTTSNQAAVDAGELPPSSNPVAYVCFQESIDPCGVENSVVHSNMINTVRGFMDGLMAAMCHLDHLLLCIPMTDADQRRILLEAHHISSSNTSLPLLSYR